MIVKRILAFLLLFSLFLPISFANADSSGPRLQVTQATRDNDFSVNVQISGSGFTPGAIIYLYGGCTANPSTITDCASNAFEGRQINSSGSFQTSTTYSYPMWSDGLCDASSGKLCALVATPTYGGLGVGWTSTNFSFSQSPLTTTTTSPPPTTTTTPPLPPTTTTRPQSTTTTTSPPTTTTTSLPPTTTTTLVRYRFTSKELNSCVSTLNSWISWFKPGGTGSPKFAVVSSMLDYYWNIVIAGGYFEDAFLTSDLPDWVNKRTVGLQTVTATAECTGVLALSGKALPTPPNNSSFQSGWNWVATGKSAPKIGDWPGIWTKYTQSNQLICTAATKSAGFHKVPSVSQWISGCVFAASYWIAYANLQKY